MASKYKGLYVIFYKIFMEVHVVKSENVQDNKNGLPYSIGVFFAPGVVILPI